MSWISGRTLSPTTGELVFVIDENANLPGPQSWEQLWTICKGLEPIIISDDEIGDALFLDRARRARLSGPQDWESAAHTTTVADLQPPTDPVPEEVHPTQDCVNYPRTVTVTMVSFNVTDGGDSVLESKGCIGQQCDYLYIALKTRGTNPSPQVLNGMFPNDILRAIAWHESAWKQFGVSGKPLSHVNTNGTTDWGLMQINQATSEQQWNWRANVNRGIAILAEKRIQAKAYLDRHPPYTPAMLEDEMIQRYNSGPYHVWDANALQWVARPPNNYSQIIRQFMATRPWPAPFVQAA